MRDGIPSIEILGVPIACLDLQGALAEIARLGGESGPAMIAFANAHTLQTAVRAGEFRDILRRAALLLNDGIGVSLAARIQGRTFPGNMNGTDMTPRILQMAAERNWRVFLLGSTAEVAQTAAAKLGADIPGLQITGTHSGFFSRDEESQIVEQIRALGNDLLVVGMGNPAQEKWLDQNLAASGARLGIGVGAYLDFAAGAFKRAPDWMRRARLEWLYRLVNEPSRLWRRYLAGAPEFLARVAWAEIMRRRK